MIKMTFEVTFDDADTPLVEKYLKETDMTISEVARQAILEMIFDDDADLTAYNNAIAEYKKNPVSFSHEELWKKLGI